MSEAEGEDSTPRPGDDVLIWSVVWAITLLPTLLLTFNCWRAHILPDTTHVVKIGYFCLLFWTACVILIGGMTRRLYLGSLVGPGVGITILAFAPWSPEVRLLSLPLTALLGCVLTAGTLSPAALLVNLIGYVIFVAMMGAPWALALRAMGWGVAALLGLSIFMGMLRSRRALAPLLDRLDALSSKLLAVLAGVWTWRFLGWLMS